ncbi:hypothetical protein [Streptomyces aureus]|uniref:hypothetical protein n=1 Tax=Streptomyces aureus TaxID=193461 RepID=UPI00363EE913
MRVLWVVLGERGFFSAVGDYALSDDVETSLSTRPTPERWRVSATACTPLPGPTVTMKSRMP